MHHVSLTRPNLLCLVQPALEQLAFQNVGCSINACNSLAELVQNAHELRRLRLYNNMSDDAGAAAIAKVKLCCLHAWLRYFKVSSHLR